MKHRSLAGRHHVLVSDKQPQAAEPRVVSCGADTEAHPRGSRSDPPLDLGRGRRTSPLGSVRGSWPYRSFLKTNCCACPGKRRVPFGLRSQVECLRSVGVSAWEPPDRTIFLCPALTPSHLKTRSLSQGSTVLQQLNKTKERNALGICRPRL